MNKGQFIVTNVDGGGVRRQHSFRDRAKAEEHVAELVSHGWNPSLVERIEAKPKFEIGEYMRMRGRRVSR
jgi:hypothetical protein